MKIEATILRRVTLAVCVVGALVSAAEARSVKQRNQLAHQRFESAERLREALDGRPESQRTRGDYQRVIDAYRKVYYTAPRFTKADAAAVAVAELLDEQGRVLNDPKSYKDAIGQLVFLRREYPASKYRVEALFTIGEIFRDDLNDRVQAKATFEDYLQHYPNSRLAPQARQALAEIAEADSPKPGKKKSGKLTSPPRSAQSRSAKTKAAWAEITPPGAPAMEAQRRQEKPSPTLREHDSGTDASPDQGIAANAALDQDRGSASLPAQDVSLNQPAHHIARLTSVRHWSTPDYTRVAIDLEQEVEYQGGRVPHPDRIFFDLIGAKVAPELIGKSFEVEAGFLHRIRIAQYKANVARVVLDVDDVAEYSAFLLPNPYRLIIDIHGKMPARHVSDDSAGTEVTVTQFKHETNSKLSDQAVAANTDRSRPVTTPDRAASGRDRDAGSAEKTVEVARVDLPKTDGEDPVMDEPARATSKPTTAPTFQSIAPKESSRNRKTSSTSHTTTHVAAPTATGDRSLIRALGLKIGKIVVDAGHGGHDTGTIGPNGVMEKDVVLDVAHKLGKLLETRLGAEVVYTRDDDTFIPLETRTAIANREQADMFISIHANSSSDTSARGVETYYLNFTTSRDALEVAARENSVSEESIHELQDLVKKIALKEKIGESREFAADVQHALVQGLNSRDFGNRGVKKAPFVVLIGANMPSILTEISFLSNPSDAKKLKTSEYRQRIAEAIYKGINKYVNGLSGVKVASQLQEDEDEVAKGTSAVAAK